MLKKETTKSSDVIDRESVRIFVEATIDPNNQHYYCTKEYIEELNLMIRRILLEATLRAKANGRRVVKAYDIKQ